MDRDYMRISGSKTAANYISKYLFADDRLYFSSWPALSIFVTIIKSIINTYLLFIDFLCTIHTRFCVIYTNR